MAGFGNGIDAELRAFIDSYRKPQAPVSQLGPAAVNRDGVAVLDTKPRAKSPQTIEGCRNQIESIQKLQANRVMCERLPDKGAKMAARITRLENKIHELENRIKSGFGGYREQKDDDMEDEDLKPIEIVERIASAVKPKLPQDTQREEEMQTVMQEEEEEDDGLAHEHEHKTSTRMQRIVSESTIDPTKLSDEQLEEELVFLISSISISKSLAKKVLTYDASPAPKHPGHKHQPMYAKQMSVAETVRAQHARAEAMRERMIEKMTRSQLT